MSTPVLTILAGSNGCGKSTLTSSAREGFQSAPVLDPDAIAKSIRETLPEAQHDIEAGKRVLRRAEELIEAGKSFTVETTLSGSTYLRMAVRAKAAGFLIAVIFVGTASVEINLERVKARVIIPGHGVDPDFWNGTVGGDVVAEGGRQFRSFRLRLHDSLRQSGVNDGVDSYGG